MKCTIPELTPQEYGYLVEAGLTDLQIAYCSFKRWSLRHYGRAHNPMATPDMLRNRRLTPNTSVSLPPPHDAGPGLTHPGLVGE